MQLILAAAEANGDINWPGAVALSVAMVCLAAIVVAYWHYH